MTGLLLLIFLFIVIISFIVIIAIKRYDNKYRDLHWQGKYDNYKDYDDLDTIMWITGVVTTLIIIGMLIAIPISRLESKVQAQKVEVFQLVLDANRLRIPATQFDVMERNTVIETIDYYNSKVINWNVKGQKWYMNKWYYHPSTRDIKYIR